MTRDRVCDGAWPRDTCDEDLDGTRDERIHRISHPLVEQTILCDCQISKIATDE